MTATGGGEETGRKLLPGRLEVAGKKPVAVDRWDQHFSLRNLLGAHNRRATTQTPTLFPRCGSAQLARRLPCCSSVTSARHGTAEQLTVSGEPEGRRKSFWGPHLALLASGGP